MTNTATTQTTHNVSTGFTMGEDHGKQPGGRRFTMTHANDGVVVLIERYEPAFSAWTVLGTFELFADEVASFAHKLGSIARNVEV